MSALTLPIASPVALDPGRLVRRADLAMLRHVGLTEWVALESIHYEPVLCTVEDDAQLTSLSTVVTAELSALLQVRLDALHLHERVGRIYSIAFWGQRRPSLPWLVGARGDLQVLVQIQRDVAQGFGTALGCNYWPAAGHPTRLREALLSSAALQLTQAELVYWLTKLQMLVAHYRYTFSG